MAEESTYAPVMIQHPDDEGWNKWNVHTFIRRVKSKTYLKQFLLWIILFICLLLIAGPLALQFSFATPSVKSRHVPGHIFSEERAHDYLNNLTRYGSRVSHTRGNFDARDYLVAQLKRIHSTSQRYLRFEINLQNFTDSFQNQLQNILVRVSDPMTNPANVSSLMLSAHYDSVEFSLGSSDDGSGVVILLELLSNLVNDLTVPFSHMHLIILFTNSEERGLLGAKAFVTDHAWRFNIRRFINVDSATCKETANLIEMQPPQLIMNYRRVVRPHANVLLEYIPRWIKIRSDYNIYILNGALLGYSIGFLLDGYTYHTLLDQSSFIKRGVFQDLGENLVVLSRNILLEGTREIEPTIASDAFIYFDIFGRYLLVYKLSTSVIIQQILITLIIIVSVTLIILDHLWHRLKPSQCIHSHCIYSHLKYPFLIRCISIVLYLISNLMSIFGGLLVSAIIVWLMTKIRPLAWYGHSTLAILLCGLPYIIGFLIVGYLGNILHGFIVRKSLKDSSMSSISFDFEQHLSVLLIYVLLMLISTLFNSRLLYIILIWSIFICPSYLLLMSIDFVLRWKQIHWNFFERRYHWLFLPLIISLIPLTHTIEILSRLLRIIISFLTQYLLYKANLVVGSLIAGVSTFFVLIFIPILQQTKAFGRTLIVLLITFFVVFIVAYHRQPFNKTHPNPFYSKHQSISIFKVETLPNVSFVVPLTLHSSSITIITYNSVAALPILDQFSSKSGHSLHDIRCFNWMNCTFADTFNRTMAFQQIQLQPRTNFLHYTVIVQHVLSYNIHVSSLSTVDLSIRDRLDVPRSKTIIDVTLNSSLVSFILNIVVNRCDLTDSPFLLLFTRLMPNMVLRGTGQCQAIVDQATLLVKLNTFV